MKKIPFLTDFFDTVKDACFENNDGCARARRTILGTGWLTTLAAALTGGTFFSVLMLAIGADDVFIGYISMITTLCGLIQILSPLLWERVLRRKPFITAYNFISNFLTYGVITLIPFLKIANDGKLGIYLAVSIVNSLLGGIVSPASSAYTMQSIPLSKRVNFTSVSSLVNTIINIISSFLAGIFVDSWEAKELSFAEMPPALSAIIVMRIAALAFSMIIALLTALFVKEYPYYDGEDIPQKTDFSLLIKPIKNKPFLQTIMIPCLWTFIGQIIGNFFTLHLVENVKMSYTLISSAGLISTPMILILTPIWTVILKKRPWVKTLAFALAGYSLAYICNVFISADTQYFYFIAIVVGHLFNPCISMVTGNLIYLKLPKDDRTAFFSFYSIASTACIFLGQTVGTLFVQWTPNLKFEWFGVPVCNLQLTSFIAAVLGLLLAAYTYKFSGTIDMTSDTIE